MKKLYALLLLSSITFKLIHAGDNVNAQANYGRAALMRAVDYSYNGIVKILKAANDNNSNAKNIFIKASLTIPVIWGCKKMVEKFYRNSNLIFAAKNNNKEDVKKLLNAGADVNAKDDSESTALIAAAYYGHEEIIEILLKAGADFNAKNSNGSTALMGAAYYGHEDIVEMLLKAGAKINIKDENGYTALMNAANKGHEDIVEILLKAGAKTNVKDNNGQTALIKASKRDHQEIVEILKNNINQKNI